MKEFKAGVTAPPFHVFCRSCTCPYFDDEWSVGERAARDEDGNTYYVPSDMTYPEWKEKFVDGGELKSEQSNKISEKKDKNDFSVDRKLVNSKTYHDKFENITDAKGVNESVYQNSIEILEHRDGTEYEDLILLDSRIGNVITKNIESMKKGATSLNTDQYQQYLSNTNTVVLIHNHPNNSRPSYTDIKTLFEYDKIESSIVACHDGTVYKISQPNRSIQIDIAWNELYNGYMELGKTKGLAEHYALDDLMKSGLFKCERW